MLKDFDSMNDIQLTEYITMLMGRIGVINRLPSGSGAIDVLNNLLTSAREHMNERYAKKSFDMMIKGQKATIESDPDLNRAEQPSEPTKKKTVALNRVTARRADRPTSSVDLAPTPDKEK